MGQQNPISEVRTGTQEGRGASGEGGSYWDVRKSFLEEGQLESKEVSPGPVGSGGGAFRAEVMARATALRLDLLLDLVVTLMPAATNRNRSGQSWFIAYKTRIKNNCFLEN